jgi:hypothetical protein
VKHSNKYLIWLFISITVITFAVGYRFAIYPFLRDQIISNHAELFEKDINPIDHYYTTDADGDVYIEPVFSEKDEAILKERENVLDRIDTTNTILCIIGGIAVFVAYESWNQYRKK